MSEKSQSDELFRRLPQMGELLELEDFAVLEHTYSRRLLTEHLRSALDELRQQLRAGCHTEESLDKSLQGLDAKIIGTIENSLQPSLRPVINATGVILQTNLGRAPLSDQAAKHVYEIARGYSNLEFDLESGSRGHRDRHVNQLILDVLALRSKSPRQPLTSQAAVVVNNCAAACFLALNTLAERGEVIVSRGELIEIGGGFRIPDILQKSGAILREVGTTNRTRRSDYEAAITPETKVILRVHRSNFRMEGFTERPSLEELRELGEQASIPVFEDQGTGALVDTAEFGTDDESSFVTSTASGIALVAASGDKLLGGPQCGILVGAASHIERIRKNPLMRAMRVDKMTYAALESTLLAYLSGREETLPTIRMMRLPSSEIKDRCLAMAANLSSIGIDATIIESRSMIGGGTTPGTSLATFALSITHPSESEAALVIRLRSLDPPVIARTQDKRVLLDLRTVSPEDDDRLTALLRTAIGTRGMPSEGTP